MSSCRFHESREPAHTRNDRGPFCPAHGGDPLQRPSCFLEHDRVPNVRLYGLTTDGLVAGPGVRCGRVLSKAPQDLHVSVLIIGPHGRDDVADWCVGLIHEHDDVVALVLVLFPCAVSVCGAFSWRRRRLSRSSLAAVGPLHRLRIRGRIDQVVVPVDLEAHGVHAGVLLAQVRLLYACGARLVEAVDSAPDSLLTLSIASTMGSAPSAFVDSIRHVARGRKTHRCRHGHDARGVRREANAAGIVSVSAE